MNEHSIGFVTGFVLAILAVGVIKRIMYSRTGRMPEYDEMQKIAQGKAYKYGFFTAFSFVIFFCTPSLNSVRSLSFCCVVFLPFSERSYF